MPIEILLSVASLIVAVIGVADQIFAISERRGVRRGNSEGGGGVADETGEGFSSSGPSNTSGTRSARIRQSSNSTSAGRISPRRSRFRSNLAFWAFLSWSAFLALAVFPWVYMDTRYEEPGGTTSGFTAVLALGAVNVVLACYLLFKRGPSKAKKFFYGLLLMVNIAATVGFYKVHPGLSGYNTPDFSNRGELSAQVLKYLLL
ncbi:hypothetical protein ACFU96_30700 [Streptomyces sp. NPDC057620]|uniref:hypothetical protein n=1 Tax=Streptomyces sp. NPDC057620 TaxID=3346185 RepID=UPI00367AA5D1